MAADIVIIPVVPFTTVMDIFGPQRTLVKYEALITNLRDLIPVEGNTEGIADAIAMSLAMRKNIVSQNESLIMPIPVLRICVLRSDEKSISEPSIQSTSYCYLPIFVSKLAIGNSRIPSSRLYVSKECLLEGREGYYIIETSDHESARRIGVKEQTTYLSSNYLCCIQGNCVSEFNNTDVIHCSYVNDLTLTYGGNENICEKVLKVARKRSASCVIHVCSDFTVRGSETCGNGMKCVAWLMDMCCDNSVYVTESASYYIPKFNKAEYNAINVKTIGCVYLRNRS